MDIRLVLREEIDKVKWNSCVHYAANGNLFGYLWYLDYVAKDWDALVEGDYESVFPLVWRRNALGRRELYQPDLMREMGLYSINALSQARLRQFLDAIPEEFRRVDVHLNAFNRPPEGIDFTVEEKGVYQLALTSPYEILAQGFADEARAATGRAEEAGLRLASGLKPETIAAFYRQHSRYRRGLERRFHALQRIMYNLLHRGWGFAAGVQDEDGQWLAVNFYGYSHGRVWSLAPVQSPAGERVGALAYLLDALIRSHAGRPLLLDFGTETEDRLAKAFGATESRYYRLQRDKRLLGVW